MKKEEIIAAKHLLYVRWCKVIDKIIFLFSITILVSLFCFIWIPFLLALKILCSGTLGFAIFYALKKALKELVHEIIDEIIEENRL